MIARIGYFEDSPNRFSEGDYSWIQETLVQAPGFKGLFHLAGRGDAKRSLSISLWESEAELNAAEASLAARRDELGVTPSPPSQVEMFDVIEYA